jgi:predicted lipoprotein
MSSVTNGPRSQVAAAGQKRKTTRIVIAVVIALIGIWFVLKPPFVVRPLPGHETAGAQPVENKAAIFVDGFWAKLVPLFEDKAQDIAKVLPEIRANPDAAGEKYGRREATNPYNYMVKGTGKVTEINTTSAAGTAIVEIPGLTKKWRCKLVRWFGVRRCEMLSGWSPLISSPTNSITRMFPKR